ncbi:hypothetical protein LDENG_00012640 [Lucifuga dentata]|nr:hypothetical protein LDENG_00012640 [Lucifuga dentata]
MRGFILLACLTVGCLAGQPGQPQRCSSPPLMTGRFTVTTQSLKFITHVKYTYDALGESIRLREFKLYQNESFHTDVLLLFKQGIMYKIYHWNLTCCKKALSAAFHPLKIPADAILLARLVLGSSSAPGEGVLVNTWMEYLELKRRGKVLYMSTVTEFGCIPVSHFFHTNKTGWVVVSFFNNVVGITDPMDLIPPAFCEAAQLDEDNEEEPVDFYSLF